MNTLGFCHHWTPQSRNLKETTLESSLIRKIAKSKYTYRHTGRQQIELKQFHDLPCRALSSPHTLDSCRWGRHRCRVSSTLQSLLYKWPWFLLLSHWWWNTYRYWHLKMKEGDDSVLLNMWCIKPYRYLWTNTPLKIAFIMFSISSWFSWSWNQTV